MSTRLHVLQAGNASVQDLGRPGYAALGIAGGGAADQHAARVAQILVGNRETAPLLEVTGSELVVRADRDVLVAVTGAASTVRVAGRTSPTWELLPVPAGEEIRVPAPTTGLRSYLAVNGELAVETCLGSAAPDPLLGFAARLGDDDVLEVRTGLARLPASGLPLFRLAAPRPTYTVNGTTTIAVTGGPDLELLTGGLDGLAGDFSVTPQSDSVGLRLAGPDLALPAYDEILSRGVPVGAVEIPPSGGVIVLLRARLVTAGYPVVAVATTAALDLLGQLRPGDPLRFTPTTTDAAVAALRAAAADRQSLATRVRNALGSRGLAHLVHPDHASTTQETA
jgi:5-oxoprolinase (ATP-hydrolysing) subunit C